MNNQTEANTEAFWDIVFIVIKKAILHPKKLKEQIGNGM